MDHLDDLVGYSLDGSSSSLYFRWVQIHSDEYDYDDDNLHSQYVHDDILDEEYPPLVFFFFFCCVVVVVVLVTIVDFLLDDTVVVGQLYPYK